MKLLMILLITVAAVGCGYSKSTTPPQPGTMPTITQLNPSSAAANTTVNLVVDGTNFSSKAAINFNGMAQTTTWMSATQVKSTIPASATMNAGTVPVTVTNPGTPGGIYGGGTSPATSAPMDFTITP